ncbi:hypothetical protein [Desulfovibrio cuneatus]|uniref:hypothetical protein n=1 Tax=Desulfovibrio cuneatus TaxID=159728 RepID=UPI0003FC18B1|nr:hypothetical protein [Desulfovibrio cuneatus]
MNAFPYGDEPEEHLFVYRKVQQKKGITGSARLKRLSVYVPWEKPQGSHRHCNNGGVID